MTTQGVCRHCMRRREVHRIFRKGGGTYRRGGRSYQSSICGECAVYLHTNGWTARFSRVDLRKIAEEVT